MAELKLHQPLPELDTARLRPGLRARPKRPLPVAAQQREPEPDQPEKPKQ
jgi:hypothetical protein